MGFFQKRVKLTAVAAVVATDLAMRQAAQRVPQQHGVVNGETVLFVFSAVGRYLRTHPDELLSFMDALYTRAGQDLGKGRRVGAPHGA